jgi:hypothetical protein
MHILSKKNTVLSETRCALIKVIKSDVHEVLYMHEHV